MDITRRRFLEACAAASGGMLLASEPQAWAREGAADHQEIAASDVLGR